MNATLLDALFPRPRSIATTPGSGPGPDPTLTIDLDPALPAEGFRLTTGPGAIRIRHRDPRGLRYALRTLDQARSHRDFATTGLTVEDRPDFPVRGFMLDVSRDRVPTRRTLLRYLDLLDLARINHVELYVEHTYAYRDHPVVWRDASALTEEDLRWFDDECAARLIDFVPSTNTLGHMQRWLEHEAYRHMAESPDGFDWGAEHRPPGTFRATDENADFALDRVRELVDVVRARKVNIGADEPFELGRGRSADEVAARGRGPVYFDYVRRLLDDLTDKGYQAEFWADVFAEHPELMDAVPTGAVPVVWQYDSPRLSTAVAEAADDAQRAVWDSIGFDVQTTVDGIRGRATALIEAGVPFWVAPGTSTWQSFVGRIDNATDNLLDAARTGMEVGAQGYLITSWGDYGHTDPPCFTFPPLVFGAAVAWCLESNGDLDPAALTNEHVTLDPTGISGSVLVDAGRAVTALDTPLLNASQLFTVLHRGARIPAPTWPAPEGVEAADRVLAECQDRLESADPACPDADIVLDETHVALRWARFGAEVLRLGPGGIDAVAPADARRLLARLERLLAEHRRVWARRALPGGLDGSVAFFDALRRSLTIRAAGLPLEEE